MEKIVVEIERDLFGKLLHSHVQLLGSRKGELRANVDYTIKEVKVEDDFFKDDPTYNTLKKEANEAYKKLKNYEFKARNK